MDSVGSIDSRNGSQNGVHTTFTDLREKKHKGAQLGGGYNQLKKQDVRQKTVKGYMSRSTSRAYISIGDDDEDSEAEESEAQMRNRPSFANDFAKIGLNIGLK